MPLTYSLLSLSLSLSLALSLPTHTHREREGEREDLYDRFRYRYTIPCLGGIGLLEQLPAGHRFNAESAEVMPQCPPQRPRSGFYRGWGFTASGAGLLQVPNRI